MSCPAGRIGLRRLLGRGQREAGVRLFGHGQRGRVRGVVFRNITLSGGAAVPSTLAGHDAEHRVEDVVFENLRINGKLIPIAAEGKIRTNAHVQNVRFLPDK